MRNSILAFAAVMMIAGCGDNGTVKLDGGNTHKGDMAMHQNPKMDMAMGKATNCFAIFNCAFIMGGNANTCAQGTPQASKDAYNALSTCIFTTCGAGVDAGAASPCSMQSVATDAGLDMCNTCLINTIVGPNSIFTDMSGNLQMCTPTSAPECGKCAAEVQACAKQCVTDADCQGFTQPLTCQNGMCG